MLGQFWRVILVIEMNPKDCIFCQIVAQELPAYKVYEDDEFLAFLDIRPLNPGHTQVIPKKHFRWVWEVPNFGQYWEVAKKVAQGIMATLGAGAVSFVTLGQEVAHAHIWVVPRFADDDHGGVLDWGNVKETPKAQMEQIAEKIRKAVK